MLESVIYLSAVIVLFGGSLVIGETICDRLGIDPSRFL